LTRRSLVVGDEGGYDVLRDSLYVSHV